MAKLVDISGNKFGKLKVITYEGYISGNSKWLCICDCGNTKSVIGSSLKSGKTKSCGCIRSEASRLICKNKLINLQGKKFGRLSVHERVYDGNVGYWLCICNCGRETKLKSTELISGNTKSCGCMKKEILRSKFDNLINQKFNRLTVIKEAHRKNNRIFWSCNCECGNTKIASSNSLKSGSTKSCGCLKSELLQELCEKNVVDLGGKRYERLLVIRRVENDGQYLRWLCKCDCGKEVIVRGSNLKSGTTKSCGCYAKDRIKKRNLKHGYYGNREYIAWKSMKQRCNYKNDINYNNYGGRGISICKRWLNKFEYFYEDMGKCPVGYSLERIDVNGNYEPSNCKWATSKEQSRNRRNTLYIEHNNIIKSLKDWSDDLGISYTVLWHRLRKGQTLNKIILDYINAGLFYDPNPLSSNSPTRNSWHKMKDRCLNSKHRQYKDYGGRGVNIDQSWIESYKSFLDDMGPRPYLYTLDRINPDDGYKPSNCKWSSYIEQVNNKRNSYN